RYVYDHIGVPCSTTVTLQSDRFYNRLQDDRKQGRRAEDGGVTHDETWQDGPSAVSPDDFTTTIVHDDYVRTDYIVLRIRASRPINPVVHRPCNPLHKKSRALRPRVPSTLETQRWHGFFDPKRLA
ncbi:hypothetical protein E4U53_004219, partial [Claviceps sorghi]